MLFIGSIVLALLFIGLQAAAFFHFKKGVSSGNTDEAEKLLLEIEAKKAEVQEQTKYVDGYAGIGQFDYLAAQLVQVQTELTDEQSKLKVVEGKLDEAQKKVEEKETSQQQIKSSKEDDETKMQEMKSKFVDLNSESMQLEQKLASSMKNMEAILAEVKMTDDQKAAFDDFSKAISDSGEQLRNLISEYQVGNERLENLSSQHADLEEEYTRLVERQLGE